MKYTNILYLSDHPYLEECVRLWMRLHWLTSNNTWMGMFNSKGNQKRLNQIEALRPMITRRIRNAIGEGKTYNFMESNEPRGLGDRKYMIVYKDAE